MGSPKSYIEKEKVLAYILRRVNDRRELLVFRQPAFPEAGIQVPAGTIEAGEERYKALIREVKEECGLVDFKESHFLGTANFLAHSKQELHLRYYYQLEFGGISPQQFTHRVGGQGIDAQMIFAFEWIDLKQLPQLIANQDELIDKLRT